jgi:glycosyltransferase involved in cell wall biosynthesis
MQRLLYVLPDLEYNGAARQMLYLATGLPRDRYEVRVCVLGKAGPWRDKLKLAGVPVQAFHWSRTLDAKPLIELNKTIRAFRPEIIHAWRVSAARAVQAASIGTRARMVFSSVLPSASRAAAISRLDRWLLGRADSILVGSFYEAQILQSFGLKSSQLVRVPPGVAPGPTKSSESLRASLGLKAGKRLLACVGPLEPEKGFRDAIWALDILRFVLDDVHLLFVGSGPVQPQLEHFSRVLTIRDFVHFLGPCEDVPALLADVDIVWVPSNRNTGVNAALEAMAVGRPLITTQMPVLSELLPPQINAQSVAPDDQGALARQTRLLLDDANICARLGEAGRHHVNRRHSVERFIEGCAQLYEGIGK